MLQKYLYYHKKTYFIPNDRRIQPMGAYGRNKQFFSIILKLLNSTYAILPRQRRYKTSPKECTCILCHHCTVLYCTVLYCTVLYCTVLYRTVPYRTVPYRTVPYRTVPYRTVPYRTVPFRSVPYRTVPYRTVPYCNVLVCNPPRDYK